MRIAPALSLLLMLAACGDEPAAPIATLAVQGAAIDGSEDPVPVAEPEPTPVMEGEPLAIAVAEAEPGAAETVGDASSSAPAPDADESGAIAALEEEQAPEPDGPRAITYRDLTLIDFDVDAMLDAMLFPDDYVDEEDDDLEFPAELKALDGKEISIVGYMIPGEMEQGNVRDFMLVRDLLGCCFGGTPMPDEWIDVTMVEGAAAEYRPYLPMRVTGILTLGGEQDEAGFALGVYRLKGSVVVVED